MDQQEIKSYRDLIVWQKSLKFCLDIYRVTKQYPKEEMYGIVSQIRRSAVSIPSNIAEGHSRGHRRDYRQFLVVAFASGSELETQLLISKELGYISEEDYFLLNNLLTEIMKMLNVMIQKLN